MKRVVFVLLSACLAFAGCDDGEVEVGADAGIGGMGGNAGMGGMGGDPGMGGMGGMPACEPMADEYPGDAWEACVSDEGSWVLAGDSEPSSLARVQAYERMGELLWDTEERPDSDAFIDAQLIFVEDSGLGSRVARRYDSHVAKPDGADCREMSEATPEYCVGPEQILPIINAGFDAGIAGEGNPFANMGRIEGAIVWFFYVSTFKEANTCFGKAKDCDSSWAYFGAGPDAEADPAGGFGRLLAAVDSAAYAVVFRALLAVRCWRDLDDGDVAEDEALFQRATGQLDRALDYGLSVLIISRLTGYVEAESDFEKGARWANIEVLGPVLDRAARALNAGAADRLMAIWEGDGSAADDAIAELEILFPCP